MTEDTRLVYGANCFYFGDIQTVGSVVGLPCCPYCKGMLYEINPEQQPTWWQSIDDYESGKQNGTAHPGYRKFWEWLKNKQPCYLNINSALAGYKLDTGIEVKLG